MVEENKISKIFTNREQYDKKRYIQRERYEVELRRALDRYKYVFITGESGSGKTWLTNYYITNPRKDFKYINLSEIASSGNLIEYIKSTLPEIKTEKQTTIGAEANALLGSASGDVATKFQINYNFLWKFIESNSDKYVIFDNFETIINNDQILGDLSCLITLADDPRMIRFNPRFIIIGALKDVVKYFQIMPNYQTIASRVTSVRINGFTIEETESFIKNGFSECGFSIVNITELSLHIYEMTEGLPQAVNELCYRIAITFFDENEKTIDLDNPLLHNAEIAWISERMLAEYSVINGYYSDNLHNDSILNYVLCALKEYGLRDFSISEIRSKAEQLMGDKSRNLKITKLRDYLNRLSDDSENRNLLVKKYKDGYRVKSYKTMACISIVLYLQEDEVRCYDVEYI